MSSDPKSNRQQKLARKLTLESSLNSKQWHSAIGFDVINSSHQKKKVAVDNNKENRELFESAGYPSQVRVASSDDTIPGELLIHKSSRALWKVSDDGKRIEPAFSDDIITIGEDEDE